MSLSQWKLLLTVLSFYFLFLIHWNIYFEYYFSLWHLKNCLLFLYIKIKGNFIHNVTESSQLSVQYSSVAQSCLTLCDPMNCSTSGLPVHHQHPEFTQTHIHRVDEVIQPSHPLSSLSTPAPNPSKHQGLFQWVNSSHEVAKVLQWTFRTDLL